MIKFDKLFQTLKKNGISQYTLYNRYGISRSQIQRLKTNQSVTTHTLNVILNILGEGFSLNDIAEFVPDAGFETKAGKTEKTSAAEVTERTAVAKLKGKTGKAAVTESAEPEDITGKAEKAGQ